MLKISAKKMALLLFLLQGLPFQTYAVEQGNIVRQEVGDVVFRKLSPAPFGAYENVHSAIYKGFIRNNERSSLYEIFNNLGFGHDVIEMEGVNGTKFCKTSQYYRCIDSWKGIHVLDLRNFKITNPPYFGAFFSKDAGRDSKQFRAKVIEAAERLMRRVPRIEYIVVENDVVENLKNNYFTYNRTIGENIINDDQIVRMRSDAFVEYCYAAAEMPIMQYNIHTVDGAQNLKDMAMSPGSLSPSNQRDRMDPSIATNPIIQVYKKDGSQINDGALLGEGALNVVVTDTKSGPQKLRLLNTETFDAYYDSNRFQDFYTHFYGNSEKTVVNTETTHLFTANPYLKGANKFRAYDHAGNYSDFSFTIPPFNRHKVRSQGPLYNDYNGVSVSTPSTLERAHVIDFTESVSGVSAVRIDGPQGNLVSWNFDPPVLSTTAILNNLPVGEYHVKSLNAAGAETSTPFKISNLSISISTLESVQNYVNNDLFKPGTFYITAHIVAESPVQLNRIQIITSTGALLAEKIIAGYSATADFDLPPFPLSRPPGLPCSQEHPCENAEPYIYLARAIDSDGNIKAITFSLTEKHSFTLIGGFPVDSASYDGSYDYTIGTDTTKSDFIPAPLIVNYDIDSSTSGEPYIHAGSSYNIEPVMVSGWVPQHSASSADIQRPQTIGTLREIVRTWSKDDKSDVSETTVGEVEALFDTYGAQGYPTNIYCNDIWGIQLCGRQTINTTIHQSAKRFVEWEIVYNKTSDATVPVCRRISYDNYLDFECARFGARVMPNSRTPTFIGFAVNQAPSLQVDIVPTGQNIFAPLNSYGEAYFDEVTSPGSLTVTATTSRPPAGFAEAAQNTTYEITPSPDLAFTGNVRLTLKYPSDNLTPAQENQLKLVKVVNPATGKYEQLAATLNPANKTISVTITSFSKFMVLAPEYPDPQATQSPDSINGFPEMDFLSGAAASLSKYDMGGSAGVGTLAALKSANKFPVGNVYSLSTATSTFEPSGAIKMRYSGGAVAGLGIDEDSLAIYGFTATGDLYKLPYLTLDKDNKVLTARVPSAAYPLFAVLASSQQVENTPPSVYPDGISPETAISFGGITVPVADGTFISSATAILFSASDPQVQSVVTSGVNLTNYILSPGSGTVEISTYTGPFTLPEGVHPMYYMSVDNAGNYEFPKATTMYIDATPPETELSATLMTLAPDTSFYATISGTITLSAADPLVRGAQSGVLKTFYLVEKNFSECLNLAPFLLNPSGQLPTFTGPPGTCENPLYTASFTLSPGTHTVQYLSLDNIRNMESPKTFHLEVASEDTVLPEVFLSINGSTIAAGGSVEITPGTQITLGALDPETNGTASGIKAIYYLINATTASCMGQPNMLGLPGTCQNPLYAGPFTLDAGPNIVYYTAEDNAGNMAVGKSASINVFSFGFKGSAQAADSVLWTWNLEVGATAYQVVSATGGVVSPVLAAGTSNYIQAGLTPNTGYSARVRAYSPPRVNESAIAGATTLANAPVAAESFLSGQNASVVLGQESFYDRNYGSGPGQLANPAGLAMDGAGNLWVADSYNHRILRYSPPFTNGKSADLVIGQTSLYLGFPPSYMAADNLTYPRSITFDRNGRLWVADGRNRVLRFTPPFISGMGADLVIGADNFTSWPIGPASNRFCSNYTYQGPYVGSDASGSLWVSDGGCHRVLRFSSPFYNGMPANLVLGQQDFSSSAGTWPPNERAFSYPVGIGFDLEDNIWVADIGGSRVLKFEQPYINGKAASMVIGQPDFFTNNSTLWFSASRNTLVEPVAVDFDGQGNLYVAESGPPRVLQFRPPFSNGMDADVVIGQPNFDSRTSGTGPSSFGGNGLSLEASGFVYTDPHGRIWVADISNNRVLLFEPGGNRSFNSVGSSSFTLQWDSAFNSGQTVYLAEISRTPDFAGGVTASGEITSVSHTFTGLEGGVRYYARVRAKNSDGIYTGYLSLGSIQLKPLPPGNVTRSAVSPTSIIWTWTPGPSGTYQVFSTTGGILSGVLAAGTSWYLQAGLAPNTTYSCFVRVTNESGATDSAVAAALTDAAAPDLPQFLTSGQAADYVLGQTNFVSAVSGRTASAVGWIAHTVMDKSGNLWVTDESNCRILKFEPPFSASMNASLVIGAADFTSMRCIAARNSMNRPRAAAFDAEGRLWVSDAGAHRVLMFNPPFSNGMDADLVIGQTDFTSYERSLEPYGLKPAGLAFDKKGSLWVADSYNSRVLQFSPPFYNGMSAASSVSGSLRNPEGVAIDSEGSLWVADTGNNRVLEFTPPFSSGMPSSVIIGRFTTYVMPDTMASPRGLAFDPDGNLYVADGYARALAYKKPFSMYMNASAVLGQKDLYSFERGLSAVLMTASPYGVAVGGDGRVWVADRSNKRVLGFKRSPLTDITQRSLRVSWATGANPIGTLYSLELASSTDYANTIMTEWTGASSSTISGLLSGTTYYARVRAKNFAGVASEPRDLGVFETLPDPLAYSRSGALIGGKPEVSLASLSQMSVAPVDGGSAGAQVAIGAAASQGLITVSPMYNIGPEGMYDPPAMMSFYYSSSAVVAMGIPEPELAVYEYFAGTGWVRLNGQVLDTFNKKISVPLTRIASLFGIFVKAEDWAPPATEFIVAGSSYIAAAHLYIGTGTVISLSASDPVVYGTSSGVAFTEFRVDASSSGPFLVYSAPIVLSTGAHSVEFRSGDAAGNIEDVRAMDVIVDGKAPAVSYAIAGSSFPGENRLYVSVGSTITLSAVDDAAGLKALSYELNGSTYAVAASRADIYLTTGGEYSMRYTAEDNVGNMAEPDGILVQVDTTSPSSLLQLNSTSEISEWYASPVAAGVLASDTGSGVKRIFYGLDGSSFSVYSATFSVQAEGRHSLEFYSVDNVANTENVRQVSFGIDLSTPIAGYSYAPQPNVEGWNNTSVDVVFTGTDTVSGIAYCSSSFTVSREGLGIPVSGHCTDYAGWTSTASFSLNIDTAVPFSSIGLEAAVGLNGWLVSPAIVSLASTDSLSGLGGLYYSVDGSSFTLYFSSFSVAGEGRHVLKYYGMDRAGNREEERSLEFKLDLVAPSVVAVSSPAANSLGWNNTVVSAFFYGVDPASGLAYCEPDKLLVTEGSSQTLSGYCMDYAGWSSTASIVVNIDTTGPSINYAALPAANVAGWNNGDVTLRFSCEDALSGVGVCPGDVVLVGEGLAISTSALVSDNAGNLSKIIAAGFKIDKTAPVSAAEVAGAFGNGWYSASVEIVMVSSDTMSGVKEINYSLDGGEHLHYAGPLAVSAEGSHTLKYYGVDNAGNVETEKTIEFKIDSSAPVVSFAPAPLPNEAGWNNTPVQVVFSGSDTLSGVLSCSSTTIAVEGAAQTVAGWCRDVAGNIAYATATLNIDLIGPAASALAVPSPNGYRWNNSQVEVRFSGSDALSGLAYCESPKTVSSQGSSMGVSGYCADNAGNSSTTTITISIDTAAPQVSYAFEPAANDRGWHNTAVRVVFSGTDTLSGIENCSSVTLSGEGADQAAVGHCTDLAGNIAYATTTVNIDMTPAAIVISSPLAGVTFIATRGKIGINFTVTDNLDPTPAMEAFLVQVADRGSPRGARPARIAIASGWSIEPLNIDDGIWELIVGATDFAENSSMASGGTFEVIHDVLAPRTAQAIAGVSLAAGGTTYITGNTILKLSSVDDLVSMEDGLGLGVKKQTIKLNSEGSTVKEQAFENPEPKQGVVFTSTFTATGLGLADGVYSLTYHAEDVLGNVETEKSFAIGLDNTVPVSSAELAGTPGENGWHVSSVAVKLAANDALSGVEGIYYQLESNGQRSALSSYTAPFNESAEGLYKVYFYAKDRLGNTEAEKSIAFKIDFTNPLISAERTPPANAYGWNNTAVTASYLCTDGLSGVKSCPPDAIIANEGFAQSASGEAQDNAGNRSSTSVSGINIDKTAPVSVYRVEGMIYNAGDGKIYLSPASKLALSAADPVSGGTASGIDAVEYHIDTGAFEVYSSSFGLSAGARSVYYRSRDKAGNQEPASSAVFHVDGASPVTLFNISGQPYIVAGTHYINSQSVLSFAAEDPLTDGLASGVLITKYRLDGAAWQIYTASISIPTEGLHKLEYYSMDNVQNAEALRTLNIIVDNTAPSTTLSVGEPKFEVFGLKIITPETTVTLAASDPDAAGPASGVKSIYYELTDAAGWSSGTQNYTEPFSTGRQGTYTVRYWSADNAGNTGTPLEAKLRVSSLRNDALNAVDGLEMTGSADIAGTVRSNTTISLAGNARILGDVYASTISLSGKSQITGQQHNGAATLIPVPLELADIVDIASNTNNNSLIPVKYLSGGRLVVPAMDAITLSTGIYYFNGVDLGGGAKVSVNGKVDMLVAGDISINGGASLNAAGVSSLLSIFLSTGSALTFTGGGSLTAYVYAPYSQLKLAGNALLGGHYLVKSAVVSGAGNIVQGGETLPQAITATGDTSGKKKASALAVGGSYNVLAGPDPAFKLGEVYVFPNPAKGADAPTFHIETGIADSVKITIYTVSGRAAHEYTLTGLPAELDDGNGLSYAYEYTWRGHIPTGVYLYYIEAQKAGQKLKKTGKFAVIR